MCNNNDLIITTKCNVIGCINNAEKNFAGPPQLVLKFFFFYTTVDLDRLTPALEIGPENYCTTEIGPPQIFLTATENFIAFMKCSYYVM